MVPLWVLDLLTWFMFGTSVVMLVAAIQVWRHEPEWCVVTEVMKDVLAIAFIVAVYTGSILVIGAFVESLLWAMGVLPV